MDSAQLRAARGMIGWTQKRLADEAGVALKTLQRMEIGGNGHRPETAAILQRVLEKQGVVFLETDIGSGVLAKRDSFRGDA